MRTTPKERPMLDTCEPAETRGSLDDYLASMLPPAPADAALIMADNDNPADSQVDAAPGADHTPSAWDRYMASLKWSTDFTRPAKAASGGEAKLIEDGERRFLITHGGDDDELMPSGWAGELMSGQRSDSLRAPLPAKDAAQEFLEWCRRLKITGEFRSRTLYALYQEFAEADRRVSCPSNMLLDAMAKLRTADVKKREANFMVNGKRTRLVTWTIEPPRAWKKRKRAELAAQREGDATQPAAEPDRLAA
jgi:hypothetical protein